MVLALAVARVNPNVILTARVLDKANNNAVLYESSVVDTPNLDRTLTQAENLRPFSSPKIFQNSWRDRVVENALKC